MVLFGISLFLATRVKSLIENKDQYLEKNFIPTYYLWSKSIKIQADFILCG
jgi:hypothetical protein